MGASDLRPTTSGQLITGSLARLLVKWGVHPVSEGRFMQTASVKWIGEQKFSAVSPSGHAVAFDSDRDSNTAPGPMEMVLMALGACTATDIVIVLEKKR